MNKDWLRPGDYYTEAQGKAKLAEYAATWDDRAGWERRAAAIRAGILRGAGLTTLPQRAPLNPIFRGERQHDGYSIENVAFESLPGFFMIGNLYRPLPRSAGQEVPGHSLGAWPLGKAGQFRPISPGRTVPGSHAGAIGCRRAHL